MKLFATLNVVLISVFVFTGCSTVESSREPSFAELKQQRKTAADQAVYEASLHKSYEAAYTSQKSEMERLRADNESLKQFQKTNAFNEQECNRWLSCLRINDYLLENHDEVLKRFNIEYAPKREVLFSVAGGKGKILEFEVDDVYIYKGYVIASSVFVWENPDGSGNVGRCAVYLNPDKELEAVSCEMTGRIMGLSRQELAGLQQGGNAAGGSPDRLVPVQPSAESKPLVSEATKEKLIGAGIGVVSAWLIHAMQSGR